MVISYCGDYGCNGTLRALGGFFLIVGVSIVGFWYTHVFGFGKISKRAPVGFCHVRSWDGGLSF